MTTRIVETSDGGFTLQGLTEESRNVFSVGGGGGSAATTHRANVFGLTTSPGDFSFTDDAANKVPFDSVAEDTDDFWSAADSSFIIPTGLDGLYLALAQVNWNSNHNALTGGDFRWLDMADKDHGTFGGWWSPPDCKVRPVSDEHTLQQCYWVTPLAEGGSVAAWVRWGGFTDAAMEDITSVNTWMSLVKLA